MKLFRECPQTTLLSVLCFLIAGGTTLLPGFEQSCRADTPERLAIFTFENNSITEPAQYAPLSKGIPAMLITELSRSAPSLKLIERSRIASLLKETALSQSGGVDETTAIRAGRILGAEAIAFGSFIVFGGQVRIDTRIIGVETAHVIMAESITGDSRDFMGLIQQLGTKIAGALNVNTGPAEAARGGRIDAAVLFSKGVDAWDAGNASKAEQLFERAVSLDAVYRDKAEAILNSPTVNASGPSIQQTSAAPASRQGGPSNDSKMVEAEGLSFVSREDAIRQAQRAAVEQALGVFVHSLTEVEDYEVKKETIFSRSEGYITRFRVIKQMRADGQYIVGIRAEVSLSKIKNDLVAMKILLDGMDRPAVMVLMEEHYPGVIEADLDFAEAEMVRLLKEKGFDLVDQRQIERIRSVNAAKAALANHPDAAQQLGLQMGAQYVIVGKSAVQDIGEVYAGAGIRSLQATLQARIIQTRSGVILGSTVKSAAAAHASPLTGASMAVKKVVQQACEEYLVDAVTESFQDFLNNGLPVQVYVNGVTTFQDSTAVTDLLAELDQSADVKREAWSRTGGLLVLRILFKGTSESLARIIDGKSASGRRMEVVDVEPDRLECTLR